MNLVQKTVEGLTPCDKGGFLVPLSKIRPDPDQPRKNKPAEHQKALAESVKQQGQLQPIILEPDPDVENGFIIVMGECRYLAHISDPDLLERGVIWAVVREPSEGKAKFLDQNAENTARKQMDTIETIQAYDDGMKKHGATIEEVSKALGVSVDTIKADLPILSLPERVQDAVDNGTCPKPVARAIAKLPEKIHGMAYKKAMKGKNTAEMLSCLQKYINKDGQKTLAEVMNTGDATKKEREQAGKAIDALVAAVNVIDNKFSDKAGLMVTARSAPKNLEKVKKAMARADSIVKAINDAIKVYEEHTGKKT